MSSTVTSSSSLRGEPWQNSTSPRPSISSSTVAGNAASTARSAASCRSTIQRSRGVAAAAGSASRTASSPTARSALPDTQSAASRASNAAVSAGSGPQVRSPQWTTASGSTPARARPGPPRARPRCRGRRRAPRHASPPIGLRPRCRRARPARAGTARAWRAPPRRRPAGAPRDESLVREHRLGAGDLLLQPGDLGASVAGRLLPLRTDDRGEHAALVVGVERHLHAASPERHGSLLHAVESVARRRDIDRRAPARQTRSGGLGHPAGSTRSPR